MAQFCIHCGAQLAGVGTFCYGSGKPVSVGVGSGTGLTGGFGSTPCSTEKVFYNNVGVLVTNTRFVVPGQTYAMSVVATVKRLEVCGFT